MRKGRELVASGYGLRLDQLPRPISSQGLFGNERPLELEIGSGTGTLLTRESECRPDVNFIGVEYTKRYWRLAADRLRRQRRDNARVIDAEAGELLREDYLEDASLQAIHIYFPDPWPKRRHHPRRFVQRESVARIATKLAPGATLRIVTDHEGYYHHIEKVIAASGLSRTTFEPLSAARDDELVGTNFERKYLREGRAVYALAAKRATGPYAVPKTSLT